MAEKTEQPTARRLEKARLDGDSPVSAPLTQSVGFLVAVLLAPAVVAAAAHRAAELIRRAIEQPDRAFSPIELSTDIVTLTAPMLAAAALAAAAASAVQSGGIVSAKKIAPDLSRANPFTGFKNLVTWQRIVGVIRALVAASLVSYIVVDLVLEHGADLANAVGSGSNAGLVAAELSLTLTRYAAVIGLALGIVDLLMTRRSWIKRLMMTKDEVRREHKEAEGDPEIKAARRRAHEEMLQGATIAAVRNATVLIVNPTRIATALEYDEERGEAPRVVACGNGELARRMIDAARAYSVPVVQDVPVARALHELEVGDEIPEALYEAVAEILRDVWDQEADATSE